jgi:hypothetical protein
MEATDERRCRDLVYGGPWPTGALVGSDRRALHAKNRIDFHLSCASRRLSCPACGALDQRIHDRCARPWRHLDFFRFEAWIHAEVRRVKCASCSKTTQIEVPWARPGSGFTLLFEALGLALCGHLPVSQAAAMLRVQDKLLAAVDAH